MRLLLFIFLFLNLNTFGQVKLLNLDLTVPDTNIFYDAYFKMPNHFEIKGITAVDYRVKIKKGKGYDLILSSKNRFELCLMCMTYINNQRSKHLNKRS